MNQIPNIEETNTKELEIVEYFNKFIKKWCGNNFPHLIDSDENDGEEFRDKLRDLHHQLQKAREEERERIEAVFKEHVPPHAIDLEDSVWLKRLLNKAFQHVNIY